MAFLASATPAPSMGLVVGLGVGMVFVGLICLIVLVYLMGAIMKLVKGDKDVAPAPAKTVSAPTPASATPEIENKQQFVAAVSAVLAEEMGTDVSGIRIVSVKKI